MNLKLRPHKKLHMSIYSRKEKEKEEEEGAEEGNCLLYTSDAADDSIRV